MSTKALEKAQRIRAQGELFADSRFFILLSSLVTSFQLAQIKPSGLAVLCVLRTFANHRTGEARVSVRALESYTGLSRNTVLKALRVLTDHGLVVRTQNQERNRETYKLIDKVPVSDMEGSSVGEVLMPFKPQRTGELLEELREFLRSGEVSHAAQAKGMVFNINITVQNTTIHHAENVTINGELSSLDDLERTLPDNHPMKGIAARLKKALSP